jgi:hypothetical protein
LEYLRQETINTYKPEKTMSHQTDSVAAMLTELPGVDASAATSLATALQLNTIAELAESPHFSFAAELLEAASHPDHPLRQFGIPAGRVIKDAELKPVEALVDGPLSTLEGIGKQAERLLAKALGGKTLRDMARWPAFLQAREMWASAVRDGLVKPDPKFFRVLGEVLRSDGRPVVGAAIELARQGIRKTLPLAKHDTVKTNSQGRYIFEYERPTARVDLRVALLADAAAGITETRPRIIGQAAAVEQVDFVVGDEAFRGRSSFEQLVSTLGAALADEDTAPPAIAEFDEQALARLSLTSGIDPRTLVLLRQAFVLAAETGLAAEVFYAMGRGMVAIGSLAAVLLHDAAQRHAAVQRALAANHLSTRHEKQAEQVLARLTALSVAEALKQPAAANISSVGSVLASAGLPAAKRKRLVDAYLAHEGPVESFWQAVRDDRVLNGAEVGRVQFELQLAMATHNHVPLSRALKASGIGKITDLAALDKTAWLGLIQGAPGNPRVGLPADLDASALSDDDYADLIFRQLEDAIPTAMVAHRINDFPDARRLKPFLAQNPGFDLRSKPVQTFLTQHPQALDFEPDAAERQAITQSLKRLERVYRIAPPGSRVQTMVELLKAGDHSATSIRAKGRTAFLHRHEKSLGKAQAERVFRRANNASALAQTVAARHGAAFQGPQMAVMANQSALLQGTPFAAMFGSQDFCACEHCQSVFSPAAYLVDVLHWLDGRPSLIPPEPPDAQQTSVLDVLFTGRRADIGAIELSCTNTNTVLPHIDIVNEALETLVAPPEAAPNRQTTGSSTALRAHPEHLHEAAYELLSGAAFDPPALPADVKDAVYPFNLPFNLWQTEARIYLGPLGMPWPALMTALQGAEAARTETGVAIEGLGMSPLEWDIIAGQTQPPRSAAALWGLTVDQGLTPGQVLQTALTQVSDLLARARPTFAADGMDFADLADLLRTAFVQQPEGLGIFFEGSACDTSKASLQGLAVGHHPDRMHRFIRLWRRLGWSAPDLDRAIQVLGAGTLDEGCLKHLADVQQLAATLKLPVAELLSWWGPLDTRRWQGRLVESPVIEGGEVKGFELRFNSQIVQPRPTDEEASPFEKLFQDRSIQVHNNAASNPQTTGTFDLATTGLELADSDRALADHIAEIAAALATTADELGALLPQLAVLGGQANPTPDQLNLANLSALYRHVSLARALRLSIPDLLSTLDLAGIDPFNAVIDHRTAAALKFVDEIGFMRNASFSIDELQYLLRHVDAQPQDMAPDDGDIGLLFFELGAALRNAEAQQPEPTASTPAAEVRAQLTQALSRVLAAADVDEALAFIDMTIDPQGGPLPATVAPFFDTKLAAMLPAEAEHRLVLVDDPLFLAGQRQRLDYMLGAVVLHLQKSAIVIERLASAVGIEPSVCAPLLRDHLHDPAGSGRSLLTVFVSNAVRNHPSTEAGSDEPILPTRRDLPEPFAAYTLLHKTAVILNRLRIASSELGWVLAQGPARGTLDFQSLPVDATVATAPYDGWKRLQQAVALRDRFAPRQLFDLFEAAAVADPLASSPQHEALLTAIEQRSRWSRLDIEFLVGTPTRPNEALKPGALDLQYPADWQDEKALTRLAEVMAVVRRVGLSASTVWDWRQLPVPDPADVAIDNLIAQRQAIDDQKAQAMQIKQAVRARHDESAWLALAPNLRDPLREQQRDALVAWLIGNGGRFADAGELSDHLLLDVQMSACQLTSRIKQAISSTQLFMQRVLMGLETRQVEGIAHPTVELSRAEAREWGWLKSYRVSEANRKVFLHPENWLDPALRDNKTPFFVELENELLQNEVTAETAETAVRGYLQKLDEVARLEIVGLCEQDDEGTHVLHVFGRTRGIPPTYYHRKRINRLTWTPWEKVEAGIEGDHLIPVVFNRRLYLFWPVITEGALEEARPIPNPTQLPKDEKAPKQAPKRYYQIRLAWSSLRNGGWAAKKMATEFIGQTVITVPQAQDQRIQKTNISTPADYRFITEQESDLFIEPFRRVVIGKVTTTDHRKLPSDPDYKVTVETVSHLRLPRFRMSACDESVALLPARSHDWSIKWPANMRPMNQSFVRGPGDGGLDLPAPMQATGGIGYETVLANPKPGYAIVPLRMDGRGLRQPLFYQDQFRTFFVEPRHLRPWLRQPPSVAVASKVEVDSGGRSSGLGLATVSAMDPWDYDASSAVALAPVITTDTPSWAGDDQTELETVLTLTTRIVSREGTMLAEMARRGGGGGGSGASGMRILAPELLPTWAAPDAVHSPPLHWYRQSTYRFDGFYHPYACTMQRELNRFGLDGLYDAPKDSPSGLFRQTGRDADFFASYGPQDAVRGPHPVEDFDFSAGGAYAIYNWEVFFHVPLRIACQLSQNQRFAEAQQWFHKIFDPTETDGNAPQRFWKMRKLHELFNDQTQETGPIAELLVLLQYDGSDPEKLQMRDELANEVATWRANPFSPHAIARLRLNVYARTVVMKYIDNLIAWGDQLFRRDSMESINEATQLYVLAAQMLGRKPRKVERSPRDPHTFAALKAAGIDEFSNALVEEIEGLLPETTEAEADVVQDDVALMSGTLYFCIPQNQKLMDDYWGRVADRLFKIRHCMNIEGVVRQLDLFEAALDPGLMVRARAAGIDLASALSDLNAPLPCYRYQVLSQKAAELCSDVRSLGQSLLSALEKKDAEALSLLRAGHQIKLEDALIGIRERQVTEAKEGLVAARKSKEGAEVRRDYYRSSDRDWSLTEHAQLALSGLAGVIDAVAGVMSAGRAVVSQIPDVNVGVQGFGGTPTVTVKTGGTQISQSQNALGEWLRIGASGLDRASQLSGVVAGLQRRDEDWEHQGNLAEKDIEALDHQIIAAEIRVQIAGEELTNLQLQLDQSRQAEDFLRDKYTNVQLYEWMVNQTSSLYFQSYQLAFDLARRAERAWQFELGTHDKAFIQFGYWDGLKKGLLAGERLHHDLKRMDVAHLEANKREYELVRHVSLRDLDPVALLRLRREGKCDVAVPEAWFDLATPGHYMRRIKTVALSIPSVTGPYVPVSCTLTLTANSIRVSPSDAGNYEQDLVNPDRPDPRFLDNLVGLQSIVTSQAQQDSGLFETNLRDERYLPFEGAGAISTWRLQLPNELRQFDYETISDVVLHIRYTARDGGDALKVKATNHLQSLLTDAQAGGTLRLFSVRHDFPTEWAKFQSLATAPGQRFALELSLRAEHYPFWSRANLNAVNRVDVFARAADPEVLQAIDIFETANGPSVATLDPAAAPASLLHGMLPPRTLPRPVGSLNFFTDTKAITDLWIAVDWRA